MIKNIKILASILFVCAAIMAVFYAMSVYSVVRSKQIKEGQGCYVPPSIVKCQEDLYNCYLSLDKCENER